MEEYKRQAGGGQANLSDPQMVPPPSSSSMGMMQLPGRRRGNYPLDLVHNTGVSDSTYEATVLGELAVINLDPDVRV